MITSVDNTGVEKAVGSSPNPWQTSHSFQHQKSDRLLKQGIWVYFLLIIFEGALRKWVLPGLATPLLVIRDPLALWLLYQAAIRDRLPVNLYTGGMFFIGLVATFTAMLAGHGNWLVTLFGARIFLLHFPLTFIIGRVLTKDDVLKVGRVCVGLVLPMTLIILLQFFSPQSAWVNSGIGGEEVIGFGGALGFNRPPGIFSFTTQNTYFFGIVACFIFYFWLNPEKINRLLLIGSTLGLLVVIPLSISRGLFYQVGLALLFTAIAVSQKPKYLGRLLFAVVATFVLLTILNQTNLFHISTDAFSARFEVATGHEGGIIGGTIANRFLGGAITDIQVAADQSFWGQGLGMGTNVGAQLLSGQRTFLIAENEWGRIIGELGPFLGLAVVLLRVGLTLKITLASYRYLRQGELLPWMLLSFGFIATAQGSWWQPTLLGFITLAGGLILAVLRTSRAPETTRTTNSYPEWIDNQPAN